MGKKERGEDTELVHLGRSPEDFHGVVNPPAVRTSTILYPSLEAFENPSHKYRYGRTGNPQSDSFEQAMAKLEGGYGARVTGTGLSAIVLALTTFTKAGDHVLIVDTVYGPTRDFCTRTLARFGVEVEFYNPLIAGEIRELIRDNTALIYLESPGSATFEVQDVPAIMEEARKKNVLTIMDNTWSGGLLYRPIEHGVDIVLQAATKYIGGHSDINLGFVVAASKEHYERLRLESIVQGLCAGPEDMTLALRGLRTMKLRIVHSAESALKIAQWLQGQAGVQRVYYPVLPDDPGHALWKRDFSGANGVLSVLLNPAPKAAVRAFVDGLELFPIGSSWGGYESLLQPQYLKKYRTARPWKEDGALLRLQIGLEDPDDLIADLKAALERFRGAA
ncbi:MAG: cystathionine beta-lyase [Alphaproteobacteria bacterium]|nr:cystathionine beta-lyase [Alphaproteobacteria bacterium]